MSNAIATNPKAYRDYEILETFEAGIELKGGEVKSLRAAQVSLKDSFARIEQGQIFLYNTHINPYPQASYLNEDPLRVRKLLLHNGQILKLASKVSQKGLTLVPTKLYFNARGYAKVELGLGKGKKNFDRRRDIKDRQSDREVRRMIKNRQG